MAQDEDSFIREVNEELRRENARALWGRYGPIVIGVAVALVLATAAYQVYDYWAARKAGQISEVMLEALTRASEVKYDEALALLDEVEASRFGAYPILASLRKATLLAQRGDVQAAIAAFDAIAEEKDAPDILKNMARIRAAYLLVDVAGLAEIEARVLTLANDGMPLRLAARELLGLSAWKIGEIERAKEYFEAIIADEQDSTAGFQTRARMMLELIKSRHAVAVQN